MALLKAALAALLVGAAGGLAAQAARPSEYQVKAVFLFHFAQFVEWPPEAFADSQAPVLIGILGEDPFGPFLDETVSGEHVRGRPIEIRRFRRTDDIGECHILFISRSERDRTDAILTAVGDRPILSVMDDEPGGRRGGIIGFVADRSRIRFRISVEAAHAAGLTISSKLLRLADIVPRRES